MRRRAIRDLERAPAEREHLAVWGRLLVAPVRRLGVLGLLAVADVQEAPHRNIMEAAQMVLERKKALGTDSRDTDAVPVHHVARDPPIDHLEGQTEAPVLLALVDQGSIRQGGID